MCGWVGGLWGVMLCDRCVSDVVAWTVDRVDAEEERKKGYNL